MFGTVAYLAPEIILTGTCDARTDVYAVGDAVDLAALALQQGAGQQGVDRIVLGQQHADAMGHRAGDAVVMGRLGGGRRFGFAGLQHLDHQRGGAQRLDQIAREASGLQAVDAEIGRAHV